MHRATLHNGKTWSLGGEELLIIVTNFFCVCAQKVQKASELLLCTAPADSQSLSN